MEFDEEASNEEKIQIKFYTKLDDKSLHVPTQPLFVPLSSGRAILSRIITDLLSGSPNAEGYSWDFLISDEFLRTNLADFVADHRDQIKEETISLEYVPLSFPPKPSNAFQHQDWIPCLDMGGSSPLSDSREPSSPWILSGSYDGKVYVWKETPLPANSGNASNKQLIDGAKQAEYASHTGPVKNVKWITPPSLNAQWNSSDNIEFLSASKDHTVIYWNISNSANTQKLSKLVFKGHTDSVEALSLEPADSEIGIAGSKRFVSGSWDSTLRIWEIEQGEPDEEPVKKPLKKKSKAASETHPGRAPLLILDKHTQCVTTAKWIKNGRIYSGSYDQTIRQWDVDSGGINTTTWGGGAGMGSFEAGPILAMDYSEHNHLLCAGRTDKNVHIWDSRMEGTVGSQQMLKGHKGWVSGVSWKGFLSEKEGGSAGKELVSVGYDGMMKMWDLRSPLIPIYTIEIGNVGGGPKKGKVRAKGQGKLLCVGTGLFEGGLKVATGGDDGRVLVFQS
eukprot:TRINITY_DN4014_c0_g1_i1.p1 TRINITY_DN4014_c0_g1~~TRINITY_DN4014_c0_g1_i1.p1  ORF type:complete len:505 (-),score=122.05 TRINITY_DN4014_c0_g1_i1:56-1570(-)